MTTVDGDNEQVPLLRQTSETDSRPPRRSCDILAGVAVCIASMSSGIVYGYSSPAMQDPTLLRILDTADKITWFGSLLGIGALFGGPVGAVAMQRFGRKTTLILSAVPIASGWLIVICSFDYLPIYFGRIANGLGIGMISVAGPIYIAETISKERRGAVLTGHSLCSTTGILTVYSFGMALNWSWLAVVGIIMTMVYLLLLLVLPESPTWLVLHRGREEARAALQWLHGSVDIYRRLDDIEQNIEKNSSSISMADLLTPYFWKPLAISLGLMFFQNMSGMSAIILYSTNILASAGFVDNPRIPTIIVGAVLVASTALSCVLIDLIGRRVLLVVSGVFVTVSSVALGVHYYLTAVEHHDRLHWLPLLSVVVFITFFSLGWGSIPNIIMSEINPVKTRSVAAGVCICFSWLMVFSISKGFLALEKAITAYGTFWLFGGFSFVGTAFMWFNLPETKGKSLTEIEDQFKLPAATLNPVI